MQPGLDSLTPVRNVIRRQGSIEMHAVPLKSVDHLTSAERLDLVEASRKVRPNARLRRQFAELRQARSELRRSRAESKKAATGLGVR